MVKSQVRGRGRDYFEIGRCEFGLAGDRLAAIFEKSQTRPLALLISWSSSRVHRTRYVLILTELQKLGGVKISHGRKLVDTC